MRFFLALLLFGELLMAATLKNYTIKDTSIPFIVEKDSRLPLITMQLIFQVSGSIEDGNKPGLARLSAKLLGQGTKKLGSTAFATSLEAKAIHISAHAGTETFVIELSCMKEYFNEALQRVTELLEDPNLTEETLKNLKIKTLGELQQKEDDFDYVASVHLKKLLFENTPLSNPVRGTKESIQSITLDDIKHFLTQHLVLKRTIVAVGGDLSQEEQQNIATLLEHLPQGTTKELPYFQASDAQKENIVKKETQQAYIYFGAPYYLKFNDTNAYKARVATFILGSGGFGSRLMEEIRVKQGLAYSAYAKLHLNKSNTYLSGYLQTKLDSQKQALKSVKEIFSSFVKDGVTKEELEQTKQFLLGSEPLRNETMSQRLNRAFMEYYKGFAFGYSQKELQKIEQLSVEELNTFIHKHQEILKLSVSIVTK